MEEEKETTEKVGKRGGVLNDFKGKHGEEDMMPREKLVKFGADQLETYELIAILIQTGRQGCPVTQLAAELLIRYNNNLMKMAEASLSEMMEAGGLGPAKVIAIKAALELGYRRQKQAILNTQIRSSEDVYQSFLTDVGGLNHEEFWIGVMDANGHLVHKERLFKGGMNKSIVDLRMVIRTVLRYDGVSFVVVHNHPSGSCMPSRQDDEVTKRIDEAARIMDLRLMDHVIVAQGQGNYYSYRDYGKI
ncbi:MAG: DNA repair protein RadC [Bacteroidales bacterium]|nr:DNA repair protein RadC [Bacteroidales bacterium]